jgi:hypothetical protein
MLTLLVLSVLVVGWLQYRDPTLLPRAKKAAAAVVGQRLHLPWDPRLLPDLPARELARDGAAPWPPKTLHEARAVPEIERLDAGGELGDDGTAPVEAPRGGESYEEWLRSQGLERLQGR